MKKISLTQQVPADHRGLRLDQSLALLFSDYSRARIQQWIRQGAVKMDGSVENHPKIKVKGGETITIDAEISTATQWRPQAIQLEIIGEDEHLLVINKPAGLVVHPGAGRPDQTLVNALLHYAPELQDLPRAGIIHRLDKETSGLLVVARSLPAHHALVQAMQDRKIHREYQAIVNGVLISGGDIRTSMGRHPVHRTRMAVTSNGKSAITHYHILERYRAHSRLRVVLDTGRTHQIRVHMQYIHHPIVGDPVYGRKLMPANLSEQLRQVIHDFPRQALHAERLSLEHPITHQLCQWHSPIPQDMQELIAALRQDMGEHQ